MMKGKKMSIPDVTTHAVIEKCRLINDKSSPISAGQKCHLCMKEIASKAFASLEEDHKKKYLCSHECFKKFFAVPFFTLDPSAKRSRRQLKFAIDTKLADGSSAAKYEIRDLTPKKQEGQNGQKD